MELALRQDADVVENDIQRTADGALVIVHDTTLARTTDVEAVFPDRAPWSVRDFTLAEIRQLDTGDWFAPISRPARPDARGVGARGRPSIRHAAGGQIAGALPGHRDRCRQGTRPPFRNSRARHNQGNDRSPSTTSGCAPMMPSRSAYLSACSSPVARRPRASSLTPPPGRRPPTRPLGF